MLQLWIIPVFEIWKGNSAKFSSVLMQSSGSQVCALQDWGLREGCQVRLHLHGLSHGTHGQHLAFLHQKYRCRHKSALCRRDPHMLFWPGFYGRYVPLIFSTWGFSQHIDLLDVDIKEASSIMLKVLSLQMDLLATSVKRTELLYRWVSGMCLRRR